jgi:hypothetical protein
MYGSVWLLGLQSNNWTGKPGEDYELPPGDRLVPRGINVVVPSMKINEVLDQPKLKTKRQAHLAAEEDARATTKSGLHAIDENPTHREDFTSLLNAAVKKPAQED